MNYKIIQKSLRLRLTLVISLPLIAIALLLMIWQYYEIQKTTNVIYQNQLTIISLAISNDIAISGGDALSEYTLNLVDNATGGKIYYHVKGPDGSFITGYGYPPRLNLSTKNLENNTLSFETYYNNRLVNVTKLIQHRNINDIQGNMETTVWQYKQPQYDFLFTLIFSSILTIIILTLAALFITYLSVGFGLKPLKNLEDAIAQRSYDDINPIKRQVPQEVKGIVFKINFLFAQLSEFINKQDRFISNAAHQLRNPIAAIKAIAETAQKNKNPKDLYKKIDEMVNLSNHLSRLTHQLLSLDHLTSRNKIEMPNDDIIQTLKEKSLQIAPSLLAKNIDFTFSSEIDAFSYPHNALLIGEVMDNIIDNAITHGGNRLGMVSIMVKNLNDKISILVMNNGEKIDDDVAEQMFERFQQSYHSKGSGLGLAIVWEIIQQHDADISYQYSDNLVCFTIELNR